MNMYNLATQALRDAVKQALDDEVDSNLQGELWRHYQGMKSIASQLQPESAKSSQAYRPLGGEFSTTPSTFPTVSDSYDPDYNINISSGSNVAAAPVFTSDTKDVVTFSWSSANRSHKLDGI